MGSSIRTWKFLNYFYFFNPSVIPASMHPTIKEHNDNLFVSQSHKQKAKAFTASVPP